jgi:Flp pilus assembly protein TadD
VSSVLPRARAAAERAIALDDKLADGHLALGHVHMEAYDWSAAESELRRAQALNPNSAEVAYRLGFMLLTAGRVREAVDAFEQAKAADPFYPTSSIYLAWALALNGRTTEAISEGRRALDLDPANEAVASVYTNMLIAAGLNDEAAAFARTKISTTTNPRRIGVYGWTFAYAGASDEARAVLRRIEALPANTWGRNSALMYLYLGVGDTARTAT